MSSFERNNIALTVAEAETLQGLYKKAVELPSLYFEAKPQRLVGANEVAHIVLPDSTSENIKEKLDDLGISYTEYKKDDMSDRRKAINSIEGVRFSEKDTVMSSRTYGANKPGMLLSEKDTKDGGIYDYTKSFAEQVEDWKKGLIPTNDSLLVGATPDVFKQIGFNALPVTINQKHVDYAINGTLDVDHFLGDALLQQLPQALENPVAIIKSQTQPDRVVAILKIQHNGKSVVAAVQVDGYGTQNNLRIDSNAIASVFGKSNAITKLLTESLNDEANKKTSMFYWNKKEALSLLQRPGLQLPNRLPQDGFVHSIREKGANVNIKFKNVTETQQFKRWFGDSKVVNDDGTPKVVYHGTSKENGEFYIFDYNQAKKKVGHGFKQYGKGNYFSANKPKENSIFNGRIIESYLSIKNPYYSDGQLRESLKKSFGWNADSMSYDEIQEKMRDMGYDGVISNKGYMGQVFVAFDSTQIKSATDNIGTFDKNNPDIRYSEKDTKDKLIKVLEEMNVPNEVKAYLFSTEYKKRKNNPWKRWLENDYNEYVDDEK